MTPLVGVNHCNSLGAVKQTQLSELVELVGSQMGLFLDSLQSHFILVVCQSFQCRKCKGARLKN